MQYINIWDYKDKRYPFQIFIGGRGTGKSYSGLSGAINYTSWYGDKFILMRRTAQELDLMLDSDRGEGANPFKPINKDLDVNIGLHKIVKNLAGIYHREFSDNKMEPVGAPIGYGVALSTIASIRGIDFSDVSLCIYDEFIPEKHVRKIKNEGAALLNAYETICRNRELNGEDPVTMFLLSNSNDIYNDVFIELGLVLEIEKLLRKNKADLYIPERGLAIHLLQPAEEFAQSKAQTAVMKLAKGTAFADMALDNKFSYNDFSLLGSQPLTGYRPVCHIGKAYIYKKKGSRFYYVSYAPAQCPRLSIDNEQDRMRFYNEYGRHLKPIFVKGKILFESYELKRQILDLIL